MRRQAIVLALVAILAAAAGALAVALKRAQDENLCWRAFVERGEVPPEGDCRRL
jgi:hypothetical protein